MPAAESSLGFGGAEHLGKLVWCGGGGGPLPVFLEGLGLADVARGCLVVQLCWSQVQWKPHE